MSNFWGSLHRCRAGFIVHLSRIVLFPSGDAGRGHRPFRFLSLAGACTPPRSDFLFVRTQRLAVLFSSIRSENLYRFRFIAAVPLPPGCRKGPPPLPLSSAGGGVYPTRKQFVPRLRSMPSALPIYRRRSSSSGDAGRGRRPFRFLPQAGACTPPRSDFLFVRTQRLAVLFHFIRSENLYRFRFIAAVPLPPGCRKGPPPLPLFSAGGGVYPAEERFSVCQGATTCRPLPFHPFRKPLPKENRFRFIKVRVRQYRARTFMLLAKEDVSSLANFLTGENLPPTRSAAASPSTGSWSPRRFPTHNAHRDRSAPRTSCTSRPTAQPSPRQW